MTDYKTGKAKTRNEIEGKTKNASGNYKRQLVFYALMLSLYAEETNDHRYACRTATLSFLIPDAKGGVREETFLITDEEIEALKAEIIRVVAELVEGAPFNVPCDASASDYCYLAAQLIRASN